MTPDKDIKTCRRQIVARLKRLAKVGPMIDGSLVVIYRRCGNPNCRCARGEKHPGHYLTRKVGKKLERIPSRCEKLLTRS